MQLRSRVYRNTVRDRYDKSDDCDDDNDYCVNDYDDGVSSDRVSDND